MKITDISKDGDCFTLDNGITYIYIGCDINGMDIYKLDKKYDKNVAIISTCRVTEEYRQIGLNYIKEFSKKKSRY